MDVLDAKFVDDYIEFTGAKGIIALWGANKCPLLSSDLATMFKCGILARGTISLGANWQPGFPTWVYSYSITTKR